MLGTLILAPFPAFAQTGNVSEWNHLGLNFRLGLNINARFENIGASSSTAQPGPAMGGGLDRTYEDGFVRMDSSGNQGSLTWNWGYQNASQLPGNDTVLMHATSTTGATSRHGGDDAYPGFELNYQRDLGHYRWGRWGIKLASGYSDVEIRDTRPLSTRANLITDAYGLGGITPPLAPYAGTFDGPGPVIGDMPTRTLSDWPDGAVITGSRRLDAALYDFRLGPYIQFQLVPRLTLLAGGGLAAAVVDSRFSFAETITTAAGAVQASGTDSRSKGLVGGYAEAGLTYRISRPISAFAGAQFQALGDFNQRAAGRTAKLDLNQSVFFLAGIQWHF
jgi:hypothetical protein